jgi:thiol-disulfide isomerase/thioredoxin
MSPFLLLLYSKIKQYVPIMIMGFVIVFLGIIAYTAYQNQMKKQDMKKFRDVANTDPNGRELVIYFFFANWCPHCKIAKPEWAAFKDNYHQKMVNGYRVECIEIDCSDDTVGSVRATIERFEVDSFPTIKATLIGSDGKENVVEYDAKVKKENLEKFVQSVSQ